MKNEENYKKMRKETNQDEDDGIKK